MDTRVSSGDGDLDTDSAFRLDSVVIVEESSDLLVGGQLGTWETESVSVFFDELEEHAEDWAREEGSVDLRFSVVIRRFILGARLLGNV